MGPTSVDAQEGSRNGRCAIDVPHITSHYGNIVREIARRRVATKRKWGKQQQKEIANPCFACGSGDKKPIQIVEKSCIALQPGKGVSGTTHCYIRNRIASNNTTEVDLPGVKHLMSISSSDLTTSNMEKSIVAASTVESYTSEESARPQKVVQFSSQGSSLLDGGVVTSQSEQWWSGDDLAGFKLMAGLTSSQVQRRGKGKCLEKAYVAPYDCIEDLIQWCKDGNSRRGLETRCSAEHGNDRRKNRETAIWLVLNGQRSLTQEDLATLYEQSTRSSRLFAHAMGAADEATVNPGNYGS